MIDGQSGTSVLNVAVQYLKPTDGGQYWNYEITRLLLRYANSNGMKVIKCHTGSRHGEALPGLLKMLWHAGADLSYMHVHCQDESLASLTHNIVTTVKSLKDFLFELQLEQTLLANCLSCKVLLLLH